MIFNKYILLMIIGTIGGTHVLAHRGNIYANLQPETEEHILRAEPRLHIIFDLGGVLIDTDQKAFMHMVGTFSLVKMALSQGNPRVCLMEQLDDLQPHTTNDPVIFDEQGLRMPALMSDWLSGRSGLDIIQTVGKRVELNSPLGRMAQAIFDPESFANNQKISEKGSRFVQECLATGHCTYVLSNWDKDSFVLMRQKHGQFFDLFDDIVTSGECGICKPDTRIYQELCQRNNLETQLCVFIDNQEENVNAARALGMHAILFTDWKSTRMQLLAIQDQVSNSAWYAAKKAFANA